jgi:hypothetical protein
MRQRSGAVTAVDVLLAARRIADRAIEEGALLAQEMPRMTCEHLGAVVADSVLQAGLNYVTVVRPRVLFILRSHPRRNTVSSLMALIEEGGAAAFLNWNHHEKLSRFESLVMMLHDWNIEDADDLRIQLASDSFCDALQRLNGIGPKTVDYMSCLIGINSIAVDRHVRNFAYQAGVVNSDYQFLRKSFCCAADLMAMPRREFDAWLWKRASLGAQAQLSLAI